MSAYPSQPPAGFVPSTPDAQYATIVFGLLRHLLSAGAGAGILAGLTISDSTLMTVASAIVGVGAAVWSWWQKRQEAKADHAGSVESARSGQARRAV